jgi:hypothetical protein
VTTLGALSACSGANHGVSAPAAPTTTTTATTVADPTITAAPTTTTTAATVITTPSTTAITTVASSPQTSCKAAVHIGESTSVGLISAAFLPDPSQRLDAQYARVGVVDRRLEISWARSIVETLPGQVNAHDVAVRLKAQGFTGCWVLVIGTDDAANVAVGSRVGAMARIDRMMSVIGTDPVLWINTKTLQSSGPYADANMQLWNQTLVQASAKYPTMRIYDWASAAQVGWFQTDGIHYTSAGYAGRAHLIADALAAAFPA